MIIPATPDFGHSDFWHFNFAIKFFLDQALHQGYLPFWSKDMGTGFPLFAESQIGLFNLSNLVFFRLFSPAFAINLGYLTTFIIVCSGTYLFCRSLNFQRKISLFCSFLFGFCGIFVTHVPHFNYIQTAAFLPWIFFATQKIISTGKLRFGFLLTFILSQQLFSGYPQIAMITLIGSTIFLMGQFFEKKSVKGVIYYVFFIVLGCVIASPQLLSTWTLLKNSSPLLGETYKTFPYNPVNLLSYLNPYIFGNPRFGTYPPPSENWGIFWESTGYFGLLPFLLALIVVFKKQKTSLEKTLLVIAVTGIIFKLGKYTPLGFINNYPPFSFFRLPARYLLLSSWSLILLNGNILNKLFVEWDKRKKRLIYLFMIISIIDLSIFSFKYNAFVPSEKWLSKPEIASFLEKKDPSWFRVHALSPADTWNRYFMVDGWDNMDPFFDFRNALDANQNLYWDLPSADLYTRLDLHRNLLYKVLLDSETEIFSDNTFELSPEGLKLLSLLGVKYLTSPGPIKNHSTIGLTPIFKSGGVTPFYLYQNPSPYPHSYLTRNFLVRKNLSIFTGSLLKNPRSDKVVIESNISLVPDEDPIVPAKVILDTDLIVKISYESAKDSLLILSDTYYPDWKATIDGVETVIYPANIKQRAIIAPKGKHMVEFNYVPLSGFFDKKI